jgi:hypothetical protein
MLSIPAAMLVVAATALSNDAPLGDPPIGPSARSSSAPRVVGLGDGFLAVWVETSGIRATRLTRDGKPVEPGSFSISTTQASNLYAVSSQDQAVAGWWHWNGQTTVFKLARVDANGLVTPIADPGIANVVTFTASDQNILLVSTTGGLASVTLLNHDGQVIRAGVPFLSVAHGIPYIDVAPSGNGFLVVYTDEDDRRVRVVRLDTAAIIDGSLQAVVDIPMLPPAASQYVRVAVNGDRALTLWNEGQQEVRARALTGSGVAKSSTPISVGAFDYVSSLVPFGDGFLATLFEHRPEGWNIVVARLTANGETVSVARTPFARIAGSINLTAGVASSGASAIVVWCDQVSPSNNLLEVLAAPVLDGAIGSPTIASLEPADDQHVQALFATPTGAIAVWSERGPNQRVVVGRLDASGVSLDGAGFRPRDSVSNQIRSTAAWSGDQLLIVWLEPATNNYYSASLYAALLTPTGPLAAQVMLLSSDVSSQSTPAAVWNGSEFVIVWQRNQSFGLAAMRVDRAGSPIDAAPALLTPPRPSKYYADAEPHLAWNGSEYLLVWQRQRFYYPFIGIGEVTPQIVSDLVAQRVTRDLFPDGAPLDLALGPDDSFSDASLADVASMNGSWLVAWFETDSTSLATYRLAFTRINSSGLRIDPLNGSSIPGLMPAYGKQVRATGDGWLVSSGTQFVTISSSGVIGIPVTVSPAAIEALAVDGPLPMVAYSVTTTSTTRAFIHVVAVRRRASTR